MRIVYVTSTLPTGDGETFIYPEIRELLQRGHEVLIVPMRPRVGVFHEEGKVLSDISKVRGILSLEVLVGAVRAIVKAPGRAVKAWACLLTWHPVHLVKNMLVYLKALWLAEVASAWNADHIHSHWVATTASMAMAASQYSGIPWSFTAHRWDIRENNLMRRKIIHARFARFISRRGIETAESQNALTSSADNIHLLYMGVRLEDDLVSHTKNSILHADRFRILCPANLIPIKGHEYLIRAVATLAKGAGLELWLAGEGPLRESLEQLTRELAVTDVVRFLGRLDHAELLELYRSNQIDLVCLASLELGPGIHEGIPVALIEAMGYGVPVVATNSGGVGELLSENAGLVVEPGNVRALASAIQKLRTDENFYRELSLRGRKRVEKDFMIQEVVDGLERLFRLECSC